MNTIKYNLLLDNSIKRKIAILNFCLTSSSPVFFSDLADYCNVSKKTIISDIDILTSDLPSSLQVIDSNNHLTLKIVGNLSLIKNYIYELTKHNPLFSIIEYLYEGKYITLASISEYFFVAESTARKYLTTLNTVLQEFDLTLSITPIEIMGNEINIRYFFFKFFQPSGSSRTPFKEHVNLYNTLRNLVGKYNFVLDLDFHRLVEWFEITNHRISQNKGVKFDETLLDSYSNSFTFSTIKNAIKEEFQDDLFGQINDHEILFSLLVSFDCIIYDNDGFFFINEYFDNLKEFDKITSSFFSRTNLPFSANMELKIKLQAYLMNLKNLANLSPLLHKKDPQIKKLVEKNFPDSLQIWYQILIEDGKFIYPYDVAVSLTLITETKKNRKKRILLSITGESADISYYKSVILNKIPKNMEVLTIFNQPLDNLLVEKMNIDLCICNYYPISKITKCDTFSFSQSLLESELVELSTIIHSM